MLAISEANRSTVIHSTNLSLVFTWNCRLRSTHIVTVMSVYDQFPHPVSFDVSRFQVQIPAKDLQALVGLLQYSKLGPKTYENTRSDGKYGVTYEWMAEAKSYWEQSFDW